MEHLILGLESPLMAFGGETVDNLGVIRRFPSVSMLTGLLANALGWRRIEGERHQQLQNRMVFAARIDREPAGRVRLTDFQTAAINNTEQGWTTRGRPEGRGGGTYQNHLRYRDYFADMRVTVALRLEPADDAPTLESLSSALETPARPLFIGRKPCLPSAPLYRGSIDADSALSALLDWSIDQGRGPAETVQLMWPGAEEDDRIQPNNSHMLTDQRNWVSGLHGGGRLVHEGTRFRSEFPGFTDKSGPAEDGP